MREYFRVAAAVPRVFPGDVAGNVKSVATLLAQAAQKGIEAVVFPELCLTGYTCGDLFYRPDLLSAAEEALRELASSMPNGILAAVGLPVRLDGILYNTAALIRDGDILAVIPKTYLPSTHEFYEARWFASANGKHDDTVEIAGQPALFGNDIIIDAGGGAKIGVELCEDMWSIVPPSTRLACRGANIILNLSASNELVGKTEYRKSLVAGQSARLIGAYVYCGAGVGESTTDLVFGGHTIIAENGSIIAEGERFLREPHMIAADIDIGFLDFERSANHAFREAAAFGEGDVRIIDVMETPRRKSGLGLMRNIERFPFVPSVEAERDARCSEVLAIQSTGLASRLAAIPCKDVVIGLSGGLDSALALLVCVEAFDRLGLDRKGIHAYTMPGFGTTSRTKNNAHKLCKGLGVKLETIDITPMARQHLKDLGRGETPHDITYENTQARGRTYLLMDKSNQVGGFVVGTGDLSELALGWCTYNGDHMSMYGVNAGVPKTLVRYIVQWYLERHAECAEALADILATPVSPELLPANADGTIAQVTEDKVGPYELHDFFLYHYVRRGAGKAKILQLAKIAFKGVYDAKTIEKWLGVFIRRFYTQQFKRNCMPDGPKVGSTSLSPRGDWRMPSDAKPV